MKTVGATGFGGLWELELAWHTRLRNLNLKSLWPITYFPTNLVHPFTLRVTGIKMAEFAVTTVLTGVTQLYLEKKRFLIS